MEQVDPTVGESVVALDGPNPVQAVRDIAPEGVDRVIEVSLSDNIGSTSGRRKHAVVAVYASRANRPEVPFWPLLFANTTLRMMGSDDFSTSAKAIAVQELTVAASLGVLPLAVAARYELSESRWRTSGRCGVPGRILLTPCDRSLVQSCCCPPLW